MIMITANEGGRHKAYAEMLGVDEYLRKPFAMDVFLEAVERIIGSWRRTWPRLAEFRPFAAQADPDETQSRHKPPADRAHTIFLRKSRLFSEKGSLHAQAAFDLLRRGETKMLRIGSLSRVGVWSGAGVLAHVVPALLVVLGRRLIHRLPGEIAHHVVHIGVHGFRGAAARRNPHKTDEKPPGGRSSEHRMFARNSAASVRKRAHALPAMMEDEYGGKEERLLAGRGRELDILHIPPVR